MFLDFDNLSTNIFKIGDSFAELSEYSKKLNN